MTPDYTPLVGDLLAADSELAQRAAAAVIDLAERYGRAQAAARRTGSEDARAAFEAHITDGGKWPRAAERTPSGEYLLAQTASAWRTWQAAQTSPSGWQPIETAPAQDMPRAYLVCNAAGQVAPHIDGVIHNCTGSPWDWNYGESITHYMLFPAAPKAPA